MPESRLSGEGKRIGLIGGLAFRAGVFYYERIVQILNAAGVTPKILVNHADVTTALAFLVAGDKAGLGAYVGALANELFAGGAEIVAVTAVAPHFAIDVIRDVARGPVIDVLSLVPAAIQASGSDRVAIFGNRAAIETDIFGAVPPTAVVRLSPTEVDRVHATYSEIALRGKRGTQPETDLLSSLARELIHGRAARTIVLAGTDLSSFYADSAPDYPHLDLAQLHIDEIVRQVIPSIASRPAPR